ncbi:hypothetical protein JW813_11305 [Clostridium botulinum]|uniref:hypothetical protein n=1 Tax=Clostridium botulinum TaxID=1491 RepID=UPI0013F09254|nr:hypothetical protein [Clostridium botulinum]NFL34459.1 hypothetical protein [Clostridium botulinum]NFM04129.1 hypothetical protein [Clostridium botulinum]UZP02306.1 hypothetical protein JW813_11305 [Clostridium botulinum]UZP05665.1 hypothetical protein JYA71_11575 [Clostridium botulinum]UZP09045.1 hypothetical protein JYA74_11300 [Clostridium botulinum]
MGTIKGIYTIYKCKKCHKENILLSEEVSSTLKDGHYISCSHCGSKNLINKKSTDDFRECIGHAAYKKVNGAFRQVINT